MQSFYFFQYLLSIVTLLLIIAILIKNRFLIIKPSFWFVVFFHVRIQWASTVASNLAWNNLRNPYLFLVLTHVIPLTVLLLSYFTFRSDAKSAWHKIGSIKGITQFNFLKRIILYCIPICFISILIYLYFVPFNSTGLYSIIFESDPVKAIIARENSLKLLPYTWLKYLFQFFARFLAPFLASVITIFLYKQRGVKRIKYALILLPLLIIVSLGTMLPGSRISAALIIFVIVLTLILASHVKVNIFKAGFGMAFILLGPIFLQIKKYGKDISFHSLAIATQEIFLRIFSTPVEVGVLWVKYVEQNGFWGVAGMPKLAVLFGEYPVHVPNFLMQYYFDLSTSTGYLTTSFVFAYYSYFGAFVIPVLVILILILDYWIILYRSLHPLIVLPTVVTLNLPVMNLVSSEYTSMFITYGFFTGAVFIFFLSKAVKYRVILSSN